ncbi:hypothetical protein WJX81_005018 [Elliptochloris bilobata]|uniref:EF-hand domain-containing protein n=1 Tax=Elliptochloris bilobata TaxID=381761 RepID=A0AAW1SGG6_9CHLO
MRLPREELRRYIKETPFNRGEVLKLWTKFSYLDKDHSGYLALNELLKVPELRCNPFAARIVELFSEDGSGELDFQKVVNLFSVFSPRATAETKVVWAFAVWDFDGDDLIGPKDIKRGLHLLTNANMAVLDAPAEEPEEHAPGGEPDDLERQDAAIAAREARAQGELLSDDQINQILERIGEEIDPEGVGLTFSDFENLASRMPDFVSTFRALEACLREHNGDSAKCQQQIAAFQGAPPQAPDCLAAPAQQVSREIAKCAVMWGMGSLGAAEVTALLGALCAAVQAFTGLCGAVAASGGATLRADVAAVAAGVVNACSAFVRAAALENVRGAPLRQRAGAAMERCAAAERAPLDNRTALARALMQVAHGMGDVQREVRELLEATTPSPHPGDAREARADQAAEPNGATGAHAADGSGDSEGSVIGFEAEALGAPERRVAAAAGELVDAARAAVCLAARLLLRGPPLDAAGLDAWESAAWHARQLGTAANDLGAGLYAPQDVEELAGAGEAVATGVELVLDELPDAGPSQKLVAAAARQVAASAAALRAALMELVQDEQEASSTRPEE